MSLHPARTAAIIVSVTGMVVMAAACGSTSTKASTTTTASSSTGSATTTAGSSVSKKSSKVHLAFVYADTAENFAEEMALGAQAAAKTYGIHLDESAPSTADGSQEVQLFDSASQADPQGVAMETLDPDLFVRPLNQAQSTGVPLICVDTPPPAGAKVTLFIGNSNTELGEALGRALLPHIKSGTKGQIIIGTDTPGLPVLTLRNAGFEKVIHAARPGITFVNFDSTQEPSTNYDAWSAAVKAHPNAVAYVGPGSQDAASLAQIERQNHVHYLVGADDLDPTALEGVEDGLVTVLISPEHWLKGYIAVALLAEHALDHKALPTGWWNPGYIVVNSSNIKEIAARQATPATQAAWFAKEVAAELADPSRYIKPLADAN